MFHFTQRQKTLLFTYIFTLVGSDNKIFIWNVGTCEVLAELDFPDIPICASWNFNGSLIVTTCKDKMIRVIDPRSAQVIHVRNTSNIYFIAEHDPILMSSKHCRLSNILKEFIFLTQETKGHEGAKPQQAVYLRDGQVFTTGFSRMSERQYALWSPVRVN